MNEACVMIAISVHQIQCITGLHAELAVSIQYPGGYGVSKSLLSPRLQIL